MNSDMHALSVLSQCKAKKLKISDCKHTDYTAFLLIHFQFQCSFKVFRACFQKSFCGSFALCQQNDIICITDKCYSTFLILLVKLIQIDIRQ